jgi:hypothetical protein
MWPIERNVCSTAAEELGQLVLHRPIMRAVRCLDDAVELHVASLFGAFLPKPNVVIDDQASSEWRRLVHVHPSEMAGRTLAELEQAYERGAG